MFSYLLINLVLTLLTLFAKRGAPRSANELMTYYHYFVIFIAFASSIGHFIKATSSTPKL